MDGGIQLCYSLVELGICVWLFSRTLPLRSMPQMRVAGVVACGCLLCLLAVANGFSPYPSLTDNESFLVAVLVFAGLYCLSVLAQHAVWRCSLETSVFCCSMGYLLESFATSAERYVTITFDPSYSNELLPSTVRFWSINAALLLATYFLMARRLDSRELQRVSNPIALVTTTLIIMVNIVLELAIKDLGVLDIPRRYSNVLNVVYLFVCVFIMYAEYEAIYNQRLREDVAIESELRRAQARQFELTRQSMEAINEKCHRIRHRIFSLDGADRESWPLLAEVSREIDIYDTTVRTGNADLDVILRERTLVCEAHGISLACIADGRGFAQMGPADLEVLVGEVIDGMIDLVGSASDGGSRRILLKMGEMAGVPSIHAECPVEKPPRIVDGLPEGIGNRGLDMVMESHGGVASSSVNGRTLTINVLLTTKPQR